MGRIKTIQIFVLGDVILPGAHLLTPQNTIFHALYAAGGPTKAGTLRSIKLIREDGSKLDIDLYKLLLEGDKSIDMRLATGDTIFVPPIGNTVGVAGNIKRPAIYEVKAPLRISEVIQMSGGLMPMGYGKRLQIERVLQHTKKIIIDLNFNKLSELERSVSNIEVQDGDLVSVFPIVRERKNIVKISGAVNMAGVYELTSGMTARNLIDAAEGLKRGAYLKRGEVARFKNGAIEEVLVFDIKALLEGDSTQDIKLREFDEITIYDEKDVLVRSQVHIDGAVYKPGTYLLSKNMKVSDLLFLGGGPKPSASLEHTELFKVVMGQPPQVIRIDLNAVVDGEKGASDLLLQDGDHLFVREAMEWIEKKTITLSGEVMYPGIYPVKKGERLSSIIQRAGGFTEDAFPKGAVFTRKSVKEAEEKAKEFFIRRQEKLLLEAEAALSKRSSLALTPYQAQQENVDYKMGIEMIKELLEHLAETEVPGRLVINIASSNGFEQTKSDVLIEDGDKLYIPQRPSSVQVLGGVYNASSIIYQQGRGVEHYLKKVGGLSEHADRNKIHIVRANGETKRHFARAMKVERGDVIVVPERFKYKVPPGVLLKDTLTITTQILTSAALAVALTN